MRAVLDTNVLVSSLLFTAVSSHLVLLWQKDEITVLLSREVLQEYRRALAYPKFQLSEAEIKGLIEEELLPYVQVIKPGIRVRVVKRYPANNKFLECAIAGKADVLISGDKDLLAVKHYRRVRIQSPSEFLKDFFRKQTH